MISNPDLDRCRLLYEQGRYELSLRESQQLLTSYPGHFDVLLLQGYSLLALERADEGVVIVDELLSQWPDEPVVLDLKAKLLLKLKKPQEALQQIQEAIRLDPTDADYWGTASVILFEQKEFPDALHHAEEGLRLDAGNTVCLNIRNLCLAKLGRSDELPVSIEDTLAEDPDNAFSHAAAGWAYLEKGDHILARQHFAGALRLAPGMSWAAGGMLQALKAKNFLFRFFLRYYFWSSNLKGKQQWMFIIGTFVGINALHSLDSSVLVIKLLQMAAVTFVYLTWFVDPIFNVVMLTDTEGRHLLSDRQRDRYRYVAGLMIPGALLALGGYIGTAIITQSATWVLLWLTTLKWLTIAFITGICMLGLVLPLSAWIEAETYRIRNRLQYIFYIMALTAGLCIALLIGNKGEAMGVLNFFALEMVLFMLFRNYLVIEEQD